MNCLQVKVQVMRRQGKVKNIILLFLRYLFLFFLFKYLFFFMVQAQQLRKTKEVEENKPTNPNN